MPNAIDAVNVAVFTMVLESPIELYGIPANVKVDVQDEVDGESV